MKTRTLTHHVIRSSFTFVLALAIWSPALAQSAGPAKGKMTMEGMEGMPIERCQEMMEKKQQMAAEMKAQDAALTAQVARMNSAKGDEKSAAMAAIVTSLVEQRTAMHARMATMQEEMMPHMMGHMQSGKESMAQCPMMSGMGKKDEKSADAHKEHQKARK
jgi:hypothetical protein